MGKIDGILVSLNYILAKVGLRLLHFSIPLEVDIYERKQAVKGDAQLLCSFTGDLISLQRDNRKREFQ